jgi:N4-gp56 family major capsid protein
MSTIQNWTTSADGGYLKNDVLSDKLRMVAAPLCKFRQFVRPELGLGKENGDTIQFRKIGRLSDMTSALTELAPIPKDKIEVFPDSLTVTEHGKAIDYTGKLEDLAVYKVNNIFQQALRDHMTSCLDSLCATQFKATEYMYTPTGTSAAPTGVFASTGTCITAATRNIQVADVKNVIDRMLTLNIPAYDGEDYMCVASVNALRGLMDDPEWQDAIHYGDPGRIFSGEVGRYYKCRFIRETNVLSNSLTGGLGEAIFFGADPVVEGIALPEEIRAKIPTDYGRDRGVAWYAILAFKKTWNYVLEGETRIIKLATT